MPRTIIPPDAETLSLFLRKFPSALHRKLKIAAAQSGCDLRSEVISRLKDSFRSRKAPADASPVAAPVV